MSRLAAYCGYAIPQVTRYIDLPRKVGEEPGKRGIMAEGGVRPADQNIVIAESELRALLERMEACTPHAPIFRMEAADL